MHAQNKDLKTRINKFNSAINYDHYIIKIDGKASLQELEKIRSYFVLPLPTELEHFYKEYGSIHNDAGESYDIQIKSVSRHLINLNDKYLQCHSLGLIDYIRYNWGNDRYEFDKYASKEDIAYLNENYKCIGSYNKDWGLEESYYIYFDKNGNFGDVRYHQDEYDALWEEHLNEMLKRSPAKESLNDLIFRILDILEPEIINYVQELEEDEEYDTEEYDDSSFKEDFSENDSWFKKFLTKFFSN